MFGMNLLHLVRRNMRILLAEVQHHRRREHLAGIVSNAATLRGGKLRRYH
jgi:hypothetical protein